MSRGQAMHHDIPAMGTFVGEDQQPALVSIHLNTRLQHPSRGPYQIEGILHIP